MTVFLLLYDLFLYFRAHLSLLDVTGEAAMQVRERRHLVPGFLQPHHLHCAAAAGGGGAGGAGGGFIMLDFQARAAKRISQTYRCQQAKYSTVAEMYLVLHHCACIW